MAVNRAVVVLLVTVRQVSGFRSVGLRRIKDHQGAEVHLWAEFVFGAVGVEVADLGKYLL